MYINLKRKKIMNWQNTLKDLQIELFFFFEKTKVFERKLQVSKRDLSPNRIIKQGRNKRKNSTNISTNINKRKRAN